MNNIQPKTKILFVCLGNICRSPAAEGTFKHQVNQAGLKQQFKIDSCGTASYHIGEKANSNSRKMAEEFGIQLTSKSRQFANEDFEKFDLILAMDNSNLNELRRLSSNPNDLNKLELFRKYDPESNPDNPGDVPDPYYGGEDGFREVQEMLIRTCKKLLKNFS